MALWQYTFFVLPKSKAGTSRTLTVEDEFDDAEFWKEQKTDCSLFSSVENILPRGKSWSEDLIVYGNLESNCFTVLHEKNEVISVSFRIDFTSDYEAILIELIKFLGQNDLMIIDERLNALPLNYQSIKWIIDNSPQVLKYKGLS